MCVLRPAYGSRGGVEPLAGLAVPLRAPGAELRVCARPDEDFAVLLAGGGVPRVPFGPSARAMVSGATPRPGRPFSPGKSSATKDFEASGE